MIRRLLLLNGLATLAVVLYHSSGWGFTAMFWWTHRYLPVTVPNFDQLGGPSYYALRLIEQLIVFGVPAFLFVSGFFIAVATGRSRSTVEWKLVGTRIRNLVIPYLIWTAVIFVGDFLQGIPHAPVEYLTLIATGRTIPGYYYVPLLCQLYLLAPLIVRLAKNRWKPLLLGAGLVQIIVQGLRYPHLLGVESPILEQMIALTPGWLFLSRVFWFALGLVAGFHLKRLKQLLARIRWGLLASLALLLPLGMLEWEMILRFSGQEWLAPEETLLDSLYAGAFILAFLAFEKRSIPFSRQVDEIGGRSFGIYLIHSIVLMLFARLVYHVAPWILSRQILFQPMLILLGLGVPLLLMAMVKRSPAKGVYHYLFG